VTVNGKDVHAGLDGIAVYEFKAPRKPGKYSIETVIDFTGYDNLKHSFQRTLSYTVLK
jgi:hypothetical protein